jgi:hypothetical protein
MESKVCIKCNDFQSFIVDIGVRHPSEIEVPYCRYCFFELNKRKPGRIEIFNNIRESFSMFSVTDLNNPRSWISLFLKSTNKRHMRDRYG